MDSKHNFQQQKVSIYMENLKHEGFIKQNLF